MEKTKIDWCDSSWNPVTGCRHECQYCYARSNVKRFGCPGYPRKSNGDFAIANTDYQFVQDIQTLHGQLFILDKPLYQKDKNRALVKSPYPFQFRPTFHRYRLDDYKNKKERVIFVCSMADLFGNWVPDSWIQEVMDTCHAADQHAYLFLTKYPSRYLDMSQKHQLPYEPSFWFGSSVTRREDISEWVSDVGGCNSFWSVEPLLAPLGEIEPEVLPKWIIIGAESGNRKEKVVPQKEWIDEIVNQAKLFFIPVFMKSSLIPIVGEENMIRQFPAPIFSVKRMEI